MAANTSVRDTNLTTDSLASHTPPLETVRNLLQAKDDTSKFVGLALLKSLLDNGQYAKDEEQLLTLWQAVPSKFLDRLLRAQNNSKINEAEAKDMVDLAATVVHTFANLLPGNAHQERRLIGRTEPLVKALVNRQANRVLSASPKLTLYSSPETTQLILQTLLTIVSHSEGAFEMLKIEDVSILIEISAKYSLAFDVLDLTWANAAISSPEKVGESIDKVIPMLQNVFEGTDAVTFIGFMGRLLHKLAPQVSTKSCNIIQFSDLPQALPRDPKWLKPLVSCLRKLVKSRPILAGRTAYTQLASSLLQAYPQTCPSLLFADETSSNAEAKPFSYLFITLLLIETRSSYPTLLSQLNSKEYPATSQRLAAAFDIISSFIGFLVRMLDNESGSPTFNMQPDLLLKLRRDIAETVSLTIEYLRDRWDASFAGASGLHPSARAGTAVTTAGTRLTLTWDSMNDGVHADPLILAGIRALAMWIREDENENLRIETAGIMDMLVELYKTSTLETLDFRSPILLALEGILATDDGVESFLENNGWHVVVQDLDRIQKDIMEEHGSAALPAMKEAVRGLEIVRVLLAVVDHSSTSFPQEEWMGVVSTAAAMKPVYAVSAPIIHEFQISMLQLATALLSKAASGMQKRFVTSIAALSGLARQLEDIVDSMDDRMEASVFADLLKDVVLELENLRNGISS